MPAAPASGGISTNELKQKVTNNVNMVMNRVKSIAPQSFPEEVGLLDTWLCPSSGNSRTISVDRVLEVVYSYIVMLLY